MAALMKQAAELAGQRCMGIVLGTESSTGLEGLTAITRAGGTALALDIEVDVSAQALTTYKFHDLSGALDPEQALWNDIEGFGRRLLLEKTYPE
jgi:hypothetical protein